MASAARRRSPGNQAAGHADAIFTSYHGCTVNYRDGQRAEASVSEGLAPGEMVAIYGTDLGPDPGVVAAFSNGALPLDLGGTEVLFTGIRAPLLWAADGQVNTIVPFELSGSQTASVQVRANAYLSNVAQLPLLTAEPLPSASHRGPRWPSIRMAASTAR